MKKRKRERVLALLLVFVLASVANATLIIVDATAYEADIDEVVVVTISSDTANVTWDWGVYLSDPTSGDYPDKAELQNGDIASYTKAGDARSTTPYAGYEGDDYHAQGSGGTKPKVGEWCSVEFVGHVAGTYYVELYDYTTEGGGVDHTNATATYTKTITVVPEPATIALLGLGGLLLMRRRK